MSLTLDMVQWKTQSNLTFIVLTDDMLASLCLLGSKLNDHTKPEKTWAIKRYNWLLNVYPMTNQYWTIKGYG